MHGAIGAKAKCVYGYSADLFIIVHLFTRWLSLLKHKVIESSHKSIYHMLVS